MKSTTKPFRYIAISDIHLGHRINPALRIIENMKTTIEPLAKRGLDAIFIVGDLFDRLLDNSMEANSDSYMFMTWMLKLCERYHIKLRVLEGTKSHDRYQSKYFEVLHKALQSQTDLKYIPYLHIEIMSDFDLSILYIPDEWRESTDQTYQEVLDLLKEHGLEQVDLAFMHGQFEYQLKNIPGHIPKHKEHNYLSIVRYYIHIGHIHIASEFERIVAQGSFDRLAHGEEGNKGFVYAVISPDDYRYEFIVNHNAMVFKTLNITKKSLDEIIEDLDRILPRYPEGSCIRLKAKKTSPVFTDFDKIERRYWNYRITKKDPGATTKVMPILMETVDMSAYQAFSITRENLATMLEDSIRKRYQDFKDPHWSYFHEVVHTEVT